MNKDHIVSAAQQALLPHDPATNGASPVRHVQNAIGRCNASLDHAARPVRVAGTRLEGTRLEGTGPFAAGKRLFSLILAGGLRAFRGTSQAGQAAKADQPPPGRKHELPQSGSRKMDFTSFYHQNHFRT